MTQRTEQVESLLQQVLGEILSREVEFPDGVLASISRIVVPADLKTARVWISALPDHRAAEVKNVLKRERSRIQKEVGKKMTMKSTPKIEFIIDREPERVAKLEDLMDLTNETP